jgi:hypothetical protein
MTSIQRLSKTHHLGVLGGTYSQEVLGYASIAYWPQSEASGTVAQCLVNAAENSTHRSDVSGWTPRDAIGDGTTTPFCGGVNDWVDTFSARLAAALNSAEDTTLVWAKVESAAVWSDSITGTSMRRMLTLKTTSERQTGPVGGSNLIHVAGGMSDFGAPTLSDTGFLPYIMACSISAETARPPGCGSVEIAPVPIGTNKEVMSHARDCAAHSRQSSQRMLHLENRAHNESQIRRKR